jgi:type III secretory pathway component EscV
MLKKLMMVLALLAVVAIASYFYMTGGQTDSTSSKTNEEAVALNDEESQAVDLLADEIMQDQCAVYAKEDAIKKDKLKEYLSACIEQLKAEATMVEPEFKVRSAEEIQTQCNVYATEDKVKKEKLKEYMDLCAEQLRAEDTMVEPEEDTGSITVEEKPDVTADSKDKSQ